MEPENPAANFEIMNYLRQMNEIEFYERRIEVIRQSVMILEQKKRALGTGRLIIFLAAVVLFFALLTYNHIVAVGAAIIVLLLFLAVALRDIDNSRRLNFQRMILRINEEELKALHNDYSHYEDGSEFFQPEHPYANDLDIFGPHSLFQFINRTASNAGKKRLSEWLMHPADIRTITARQQAVAELKDAIDWRQSLQATGTLAPMNEAVFLQLDNWSKEQEPSPQRSVLHVLVILLPLATLACVMMASFHQLPWNILWLSFGAHLILLWQMEKKVSPAYERLSQAITSIDTFYETVKKVTEQPFTSPLLHHLQQKCYAGQTPAFALLNRLKRILHRMHIRLNPLVHFPLNLVLFWDWYQYRLLFNWKKQHAADMMKWTDAVAEMEALSSFANLAFNHPNWCVPNITSTHFHLSAAALGHPLIAANKRINNDILFDGTGKLMLITGSNMAGKSTFLRTVGVNMILAMSGAVVCARQMSLSEIQVISSMRIADNLEENISTFYAELKKLEVILKRVRAHEKVFVLLDEILRGTNSQDRHAGAKALIKQFLAENAVGILATHDLALTTLENDYPDRVLNYHFDVQVQGEELFFDYKLKLGICKSMNASLLMRKIGIEV